MTNKLTVEQCDRERAGAYIRANEKFWLERNADIMGGRADVDPLVQAFARHRQQAEARAEGLEKVAINLAARLAAAISLLEKGGKAAKKAAPSDTMFDIMLQDYRNSLSRARDALTAHKSARP